MDIKQLRYFLAVAETLNLSRAANRGLISQPALSRQIQLLEQELNVTLFERKARGVVLTDAGELLEQKAKAILNDITALKELLSAQAMEPSGTVTLGIPSALRVLLTRRVAARFARQFPKALLRIREGTSRDIRDGVASGETDIALFSTEEPANPFECTSLLTEQLVAIALPEAGLSMNRPMTLRKLCANPLILTSYPNSLRQIVDRAATAASLEVNVSLEADMSALMLDLVRQGLGFTVLPYCAVHELLGAGIVSAAPIEGLHIAWVAAFSRERALSTGARHLLQMLVSEARGLVSSGGWPTGKLSTALGEAMSASTALDPVADINPLTARQ